MKTLSEKWSTMWWRGDTWCNSDTALRTLLVVALLCGTFWYDCRPAAMVGAVSLGALWCRHCSSVQLQTSSRLDTAIAKARARCCTLRSSRPYSFIIALVVTVLTPIILFFVLPWWVILISLLVLGMVIKWTYDIKVVFSNDTATIQEQQFELEVKEFLPEINELNQSLLKEVGEKGDIPLHIDWCNEKSTQEGDNYGEDELYIRMLLPEDGSRELETVEQSDSSSDELFMDDGGSQVVRKRCANGTKPAIDEVCDERIQFKISHFNANSSSDSDENISSGLSFGAESSEARSRTKSTVSDKMKQSRQKRVSAGSNDTPELNIASCAVNPANTALMGAMFQCLMNATTVQRPTGSGSSSSGSGAIPSEQSKSSIIIDAIGGVIRSTRLLQPSSKQENSSDDDKDSDFEILNSEELNNF
ncbi:uncharacterized protein LOC131213566 isoform X2 [Anopheles bellator]|nr:uncharacterized protein LOC131213566 isoform X2 [Anopheles bellator]